MRIICGAVLMFLTMGDAQAVSELTVKTNALACSSERQFERAEKVRKSGDSKALHAFTSGAVLSGTCVRLVTGAKVFTAGRGKGSGIVKIRPKGSVVTYFTSEENFE
jgi:hypothetical protein